MVRFKVKMMHRYVYWIFTDYSTLKKKYDQNNQYFLCMNNLYGFMSLETVLQHGKETKHRSWVGNNDMFILKYF